MVPLEDPLGGRSGGARSAFLSLFVATGAAMLAMGIILPILPHYARSMGASNLVLGVIIAGFALARGVSAPFLGHLSDRRGRKRLLLVGLGLYALLGIAYVLASDPLMLLLIRLADGLSSAMVTPIAQSYIGDITPEGREGEVMNTFYIGLFMGGALGPGLGGYLTDAFGIQAPFLALSLVAFLAFLLVLVLVPEGVPHVPRDGQASLREGFRAVVRDPNMRAVLAYISARGFYRWGFNAFFPIFAVTAVGMSLTQVGLVLTGYMLVGGILQWPMGRVADRWRAHRTPLIAGGAFVAALPMFLIPETTNPAILFILVLIMGSTSAVSRASAVALRTERGRVHGMGAVTGAFTSFLSLGQVLGPLVFGAIVDVLSVQDAFVFGGLVGLLGALATWWYLVQAASGSGAPSEAPVTP